MSEDRDNDSLNYSYWYWEDYFELWLDALQNEEKMVQDLLWISPHRLLQPDLLSYLGWARFPPLGSAEAAEPEADIQPAVSTPYRRILLSPCHFLSEQHTTVAAG